MRKMENRTFHVVVRKDGKVHAVEVCACSIYHAIDKVYNEGGMRHIQPDRKQYKIKK